MHNVCLSGQIYFVNAAVHPGFVVVDYSMRPRNNQIRKELLYYKQVFGPEALRGSFTCRFCLHSTTNNNARFEPNKFILGGPGEN